MKTREFGPRRVPVPVVGQGTWKMEEDRKGAIEALRRGIDLGATHIDTAEMYGSGEVERIVGEAIRGRREEVFLVSKVLPTNASYAGTIAACERSLENLRTDFLDVYLLHWSGSIPLEETFRAFERLLADGKIRAYGVSNFDVDEMEEAVRIAGAGKIACNQVLYHLRERGVEHRVLPWCRLRGIPIVAYSPYGQGDFPAEAPVLRKTAEARRATVRQVALAFLLRHAGTFVIPKSSTPDHVEENVGACGLELTAEEIEELDRAFPLGPDRGLPML